METTLERINSLSAERSTLYRLATNGRRGDPHVRRGDLGAVLSREFDRVTADPVRRKTHAILTPPVMEERGGFILFGVGH